MVTMAACGGGEAEQARRIIPTARERFAGAIDNVGGEMLTWLTRTVGYWGSIASVGLAGSPKLETTVMPFILRGVNLLGINSSATPRGPRLEVWKRIGSDLGNLSFWMVDRWVNRANYRDAGRE